jgi:hypothetical protein
MKAIRGQRRAKGLREIRLIVPDARSRAVRRRIAAQVARLAERDALQWIESASVFNEWSSGNDRRAYRRL